MATTPKTMCTNIGRMERMLRVIAGSTGWCPLYIPFGISTYKNQ